MRAPAVLSLAALGFAAACAVDEMPGPSEGEAIFVQNCTACHDAYVFYDPFAAMGLSGN